MNIFYQYSWLKSLSPIRGDQINEINTVKALRKFAKVSYGQSIDNTDISIIRASKEAFRQAKGKRLWMASPYDREMFEKADLIFTFTDTWTKWLREGKTFSLNPDGIAWGDKVVTFPQTIGEDFVKTSERKPTKTIRIGIFGRLKKSTYPVAFLDNLSKINVFHRIEVVQGYNATNSHVSYKNMPASIRHCDLILVGQHGDEWEFCGNIKPLEAAACGRPVILERSSAREETFGKNYRFFVERGTMASRSTSAMHSIIKKINFYKNSKVLPDMPKYVEKHRIENTSKVLEGILKRLL